MTVNFQYNLETAILVGALIISVVGNIYTLRYNRQRYGLLMLLAGFTGSAICYLFVVLGYYTFPYRLFPDSFPFHFESVTFAFSFFVLLGVRYSPVSWAYKIPFYWTIIILGVFLEMLIETKTEIIKYTWAWDFWDSFTAWWIFLLIFEWIGGKIVPPESRKPIPEEAFRYGNWAWFVFHAVMLSGAFGIGVYLGTIMPKQ